MLISWYVFTGFNRIVCLFILWDIEFYGSVKLNNPLQFKSKNYYSIKIHKPKELVKFFKASGMVMTGGTTRYDTVIFYKMMNLTGLSEKM